MTAILLTAIGALVAVAIVVLLVLLSRQVATRHLAQGLLAAQSAAQAGIYRHLQSMTTALAAAEKSLRDATANTREGVAETLQHALQNVSSQLADLADSQKAELQCLVRQIDSLTVSTEARLEEMRATLEQQLAAPADETRQRLEELHGLVDSTLQKSAETSGQALDEANLAVSQLQQLVHSKLSDALAVQRSQVDSVLGRLDDLVQRNAAELAAIKCALEERVAGYQEENSAKTAQALASFHDQLKAALDGVSERLAGAQARNEAGMDTLRIILERNVAALRDEQARTLASLEAGLQEALEEMGRRSDAAALQAGQTRESADARLAESATRQERRLEALASQVASLVEQQARMPETIEQKIAGRQVAVETSLRDMMKTGLHQSEETAVAVRQLQETVAAARSDSTRQDSRLDALAGQLTSLADTYNRLIASVEDRLRQSRAAVESDLKELAGIAVQRNEETAAAVRELRDEICGRVVGVDERLAQSTARFESNLKDLAGAAGQRNGETAAAIRELRDSVTGLIAENVAQTEARLSSLSGQLQQLAAAVEQRLAESRSIDEAARHVALEQQRAEIASVLSDYQVVVERNAADVQSLVDDFEELRKALTEIKSATEALAAAPPALPRSGAAPTVPGRTGPAVFLPGPHGRPGEFTWLPIDARYPVDLYERLTRARAAGDPQAAVRAEQELEQSIIDWARAMRDRYARVPNTADFYIMFLPEEELHAEILQRAGLCRALHRDYHVVIAGPSTLETLLADSSRRAAASPRVPTAPPSPLP